MEKKKQKIYCFVDESEALIRLADDRWAGCLRMAYKGNKDCEELVAKAKNIGLLKKV